LIAEVVLEFYADLDWLPKTLPDLLKHYENSGYLHDIDDYQTTYSADAGAFFVLIQGEQVVGCGGLRRLNATDGELVRLWLKKEKRKMGLGRMLFANLMKAAEDRGYARVFLDTSSRCVDAIALFRRNGFVDCAPYKQSIGEVFMCRILRGDSR
jgi:ribosomal protein S18 acetylase RimI-like enzyme